MESVIHFRSGQEICASWGPVVIRICDGVRTEIDDLDRVQGLFEQLLAARPLVGMLLVFTHGTPLPIPTTQRHAANRMRELDGKLVMSVAMLGLGFWATAMRATFDLLIRTVSRGTIAIEGTIETAAMRLSSELIGVDPEALLEVHHRLWSELEQERRAQAL